MADKKKIRTIAIHLPQFHPTPENDKWWGKGFTEWTNVTKAKPLFKGHYQPHLPSDLGYYDLRLEQTRVEQAKLAKEYGIEGFCYYHYWFNGKRILNEPLDRILASKEPDFPFMYCWANENWTRRWDGADHEVLMEQKYNFDDDREHIKWLCKNVFSDKRYITINGAPVFVIYRPNLLPDIKKTIEIWREEAIKLGFEKLYVCGFQSMGTNSINPNSDGFDAAIEFQPNWSFLKKTDIWSKFRYKFNIGVGAPSIFNYDLLVKKSIENLPPNYKQYPCITPCWDNSARKKKFAIIIKNSTPQKYYNWLKIIIEKFKPYSLEENFIFINAWNEWAEGNHLEPDQKWGKEYLEVTKKALEQI